MANKNNNRYKVRKRNNIKQEVKSLFNTPPVLIHDWNGLCGLENDKYRIVVDEDRCCGWIKPKFDVSNEDHCLHNKYLSTHTFYDSSYYYSTTLLRRFGFNVQLANWDGETIYCRR